MKLKKGFSSTYTSETANAKTFFVYFCRFVFIKAKGEKPSLVILYPKVSALLRCVTLRGKEDFDMYWDSKTKCLYVDPVDVTIVHDRIFLYVLPGQIKSVKKAYKTMIEFYKEIIGR